MKNKKIIIGSRRSKLALIYAHKAKDNIILNTNLEDNDIIIKKISTEGDQAQDLRLSEIGGKRDVSFLDDKKFVLLRRKRNRAVTFMYFIFFLSFIVFMSFMNQLLLRILN